jgi:hypothetical protein
MDNKTLQNNIDIFTILQPDQKLIVDSNGKISIDERWIQGARRTLTGDSKIDIIDPIEITLKHAIDNDYEDIEKIMTHLDEVLSITYPDFTAMKKLLIRLGTRKRDRDSDKQHRETGRQISNMIYLKSFQYK